MRHRLLNLVTALSLLLCAAVVVLWVRSETGRAENFRCSTNTWSVEVASAYGLLGLTAGDTTGRARYAQGGGTFEHNQGAMVVLFWIVLRHEEDTFPLRRYFGRLHTPATSTVVAPHWSVAAPLALLPVWRSWQAVAARRRRVCARRGVCAACGYDLTGNVSGVCPECGTKVR